MEQVEQVRDPIEKESQVVITPKYRDLESILEISNDLTGRFLGACRVQASKPIGLDIPTREALFDDVIGGFRVSILPSPLTRTMVVWIDNVAKFSVVLDKGWVLPGTYQEQCSYIELELKKLHYGLYIDCFCRPEHFYHFLKRRDVSGLEKFIPEGVTFKFKGNKACFFYIDGVSYYLKCRSRHDVQAMKEEFVQFREGLIEQMVKLSYVPTKSPNYNGSIERYGQMTFYRAIAGN